VNDLNVAAVMSSCPTPTTQDNDQVAGPHLPPKRGTTIGGAVRLTDISSLDSVLSTAEARVVRLRGYGNGIVAPLAIEFIKTYLDVCG
jgi:hypothetical protein